MRIETFAADCTLASKLNNKDVIMQTLQLVAKGKKQKECNAMLDSGAGRTYITSSLVQRIHPEWLRREYVASCAFGECSASSQELRNIYKLQLTRAGNNEFIEAAEVPVICAPLVRKKVSTNILDKCVKLNLVED